VLFLSLALYATMPRLIGKLNRKYNPEARKDAQLGTKNIFVLSFIPFDLFSSLVKESFSTSSE
jgi:hypothetical protein